MQFTSAVATAILGFSALAAAGPAARSYETVTVTDVKIVINADYKVTDVSLKLSGDDATDLACSAKNPVLSYDASASTQCGDSLYSFNLLDSGLSSFQIDVFHSNNITESGYFSPGQWGQGYLNVECKNQGEGRVCTSTAPSSLFLTGQ
ncbi:hypothetical protein BJY04DRAFT_223357 [Aspergillus karnatakaensis]|uniref:uncharacterized protein n=1 Tax=Aspergillus karnatakaensis TaxID=1810916 RepID=UPI003CCCAE1B